MSYFVTNKIVWESNCSKTEISISGTSFLVSFEHSLGYRNSSSSNSIMTENSVATFNVSQAIIERKDDRKKRAEQKRLDNLKLIESLNELNENGEDLRYVLPEEVWEMVLDHLGENPEDLDTAWNTSSLYQQLLEKRKLCDILFALALNVEDFFNELRVKEFLQLRLVCRSLRNVIDHWKKRKSIEDGLAAGERLSKCFELEPVALGFPFQMNERDYGLLLKSDMLKLEQSFNPRNPGCAKRFFQGSIDVDLGELEDIDEDDIEEYMEENYGPFKNLCHNILQNFGSQLWNFHITLCVADYLSLSEFYLFLVDCVRLLPNIVFFSLESESTAMEDDDIPNLAETIEANPFPYLKKLRNLEISAHTSVPAAIIKEIARSNKHLEQIYVFGNYTLDETKSFLEPLESLTSFHVSIPKTEDLPASLFNLNWPLKKLNLQISHCTIPAAGLFKLLENFQTLTSLKLTVNEMEGDWGNVSVLHLPKLTHFAYFCYDCPTDFEDDLCRFHSPYSLSVDYLLECRNLEQLTWISEFPCEICTKTQIEELKECVQFKAGFADFSVSNIWSLFPFLNSVTVKRSEVDCGDELDLSIPREVETIPRPNY